MKFKSLLAKIPPILKKFFLQSSLPNVVMAIGTGIFVGLIIMLFVAESPGDAFTGMAKLLTGGLSSIQIIGNVLFSAAPLILVGLAVAFAFKTGLFNIGASGQFMIGGAAALYVANLVTAPVGIHFILAMLASIIAGGIWGFIPGFLKSKFNVNEVITTIMMNYIAMYTVIMLVYNPAVYSSGITAINNVFPTAAIPRFGLDRLFPGSYIDMSIIIAIGVAILVWFVLKKTTLGYQLTSVGLSKEGSKYAGINVKRNIIVSMVISGALAGLAAAMNYLPFNPDVLRPDQKISMVGFEGISIALIAQSNPIGIIFSGIFISLIKKGSLFMQFYGFTKEISGIIVAVIIYMIAISSFIGNSLKSRRIKREILKKTEIEGEQTNV